VAKIPGISARLAKIFAARKKNHVENCDSHRDKQQSCAKFDRVRQSSANVMWSNWSEISIITRSSTRQRCIPSR